VARVVVEQHPQTARRAILRGLRAYNRSRVGRQPVKAFAVTLRDDAGAILGGATGEMWSHWLFVQLLWLDEAARGQDGGTAVLAALEAEARAAGCTHAYVDTFTFQAPDFYRKQGYVVFGELADFPAGHSRLWLSKAL
jgi:GNAT superfamily N-acetyltransferase